MPSIWLPACPAVDPVISRRKFGILLGAIPALATFGFSGQVSAASKIHKIRITKFRFEPSKLSVSAGDIVEWINEDFAPHTATEQVEANWDTGELGRNDSAQIVFNEPGEHAYYCAFHPHMKGQIKVE